MMQLKSCHRNSTSVRAHLARRDDPLVTVRPLLERTAQPQELFAMSTDEHAAVFDLETKSMIGRPLGDSGFIAEIERRLGRTVARQKPGRKPAQRGE